MNCKIYREMLHSYMNHELDPAEAAAVERHIAACPDCQNEAEEIMRLKAAAKAMKLDKIEMDGLKKNIMSTIKTHKKILLESYDIKVLTRLGTSLVACGLLAFVLSFSHLGSSNYDFSQPMSVINKGLQNMSSRIVDLNGITFRIEEKIRGGMNGEM